jgi:hypothetical protein
LQKKIFQFKPFFFEKTQFENSIFLQQKRSFLFFPLFLLIREREKKRDEKKGTIVFVAEKLNFQIEFSQRKKA